MNTWINKLDVNLRSSPGTQKIYSAEKVQKVWWCDCVNILLRFKKKSIAAGSQPEFLGGGWETRGLKNTFIQAKRYKDKIYWVFIFSLSMKKSWKDQLFEMLFTEFKSSPILMPHSTTVPTSLADPSAMNTTRPSGSCHPTTG